MNQINISTVETGTIAEIHARLLREGHHVSQAGLRRWVRTGLLPAVQSGRRYYVRYASVIHLLTNGNVSNEETSQPQPVQGIRPVS